MVPTTKRIFNRFQKHGNKQNEEYLSKFYISVSRKW